MKFDQIYYEPDSLNFELGKRLKDKYKDNVWIPIENHNRIEEMQKKSNADFPKMKRNLIIGTRKTHKYNANQKISDFLVPYTSSGCTAMCLYCYLVCNYNKCAYLRLFMNREQMLDKLIRTANKSEEALTFEIGSNSDLILENTITDNLVWTIENFSKSPKGTITFPTKFDMVDPLLSLNHNGKVIFRMSVNPEEIIRRIEIGTSSLEKRIEAINKMCEAGYKVGILIAPIIPYGNWKEQYSNLLTQLSDLLTEKAKKQLFIECIFMTYSYVHRAINAAAFPNAPDLYQPEQMMGRGMGKYCFRPSVREEGTAFLEEEIHKKLQDATIVYFS